MTWNPATLLTQDEESEKWVALPYEVAHAVVRTLVLHTKVYIDTKNELEELLQTDPHMKQSQTKKLKQAMDSLASVERFAVMNRRTGWVATPEWLQRSMTVGPNGEPVSKGKNKKTAWVLTLKIEIKGKDVSLELKPRNGSEFRAVRCLRLREGEVETTLGSMTVGYDHLLENAETFAEQPEELVGVGHNS